MGQLLERGVAAHALVGGEQAAHVRRARDVGMHPRLERGDLVPDELVFEILSNRVLEAARHGGYVLDGFPRTLHQAEEAYSLAQSLEGVTLQAVVYLRVSQDELHRRLEERAGREGRNDDTETGIAHRFEVFDAQTQPLLDFYDKRGLLVDVNGEQTVEEVFADITKGIDGLHGR